MSEREEEGMGTSPDEPLWAVVLFFVVVIVMAVVVIAGVATGGWPFP